MLENIELFPNTQSFLSTENPPSKTHSFSTVSMVADDLATHAIALTGIVLTNARRDDKHLSSWVSCALY